VFFKLHPAGFKKKKKKKKKKTQKKFIGGAKLDLF
jgi:hypothetical protein